MRFLLLLPLCFALSGCYAVIGGHQTTGAGATTTTTGAATRLEASAGPARLGASFGTPPAPNAPGGQVAFSRGASAVLFLGLVIADTVNYLGTRFGNAPRPAPQRASIAETCSCYGWKPDLTPGPVHE